MRTFSRVQLREVLEAWMREPETDKSHEDSLYYKGVAAYLEYLDMYQFKSNGHGGKMLTYSYYLVVSTFVVFVDS